MTNIIQMKSLSLYCMSVRLLFSLSCQWLSCVYIDWYQTSWDDNYVHMSSRIFLSLYKPVANKRCHYWLKLLLTARPIHLDGNTIGCDTVECGSKPPLSLFNLPISCMILMVNNYAIVSSNFTNICYSCLDIANRWYSLIKHSLMFNDCFVRKYWTSCNE